MPLFKILPNQKLEKVDRRGFANEEELHQLMEKNLSHIMGVRQIAREYPIPNGKIDTLGLDEDNVPVIIEYKWKKNLSAIIQGLFYLNWVMQNKKPFESIVKDKLGKEVKVNWLPQPRLLILAQDFDVKELSAINLMGPSVELKKYSVYSGLFNIEDVNIVKSKAGPKPPAGNTEGEKYTVEGLLKKATPQIKKIFSEIRDRILSISESVWEKVGSYYCDYRTASTFASFQVQKQKIRILIKMGERTVNDPQKKCKPIPPNYGYGLLNTRFDVSDKKEIDYSMKLIMQAYKYVSE